MIKLTVVLLLLFAPFIANAQAFGPQLTYHGRILDTANSNAPVSGSVQFLMQVVHPDVPTCVLYQETQTQNLTAADGNFTLTVNGGSSTLPAALLNPFADIFITDPTRTINCINGGTVPGTANSRRLNVFFVPPGGSAYEPLPSQAINYVPLAIEALNTNAVGGFGATSLLRVVEINGFGVPVPYAVPAITRPLYEELDLTIKGQSSYYVTSQGTVARFSVPLAGEVTGAQSATVVSRIMGRPINPAGGTYVGGEVMYFDGTNWISKPGLAGTVKTVSSSNNYLTVGGGPPSFDATIDPLLTLNVGTAANTVAAGNDPRIVGAFQASTPFIGDVTGTVSATVVATVGGKTSAQISQSVSDTLAATSANTASTIVKRDGSGNVTVNTLSATNTSTRNLLLYNAGNTQYATINVPAALAVSYVLTLPNTAPVSGFVLATDAAGNTSWISPTTGNVTNVTATAPLASTGGQTPTISITRASTTVDGYLAATDFLIFNNKVASVTVTTPLTLGGTSQTPIIGLQNSGVTPGTYTKVTVDSKGIVTSGTTLIASDIPNLDASKITTGTFPIARGGTGASSLTGNGFVAVDASGSALTSTACAANEVPFFNGTTWICKLAASNNSSATIVMRDANGDFTARNITTVQNMTVQANLRVQNGMTNYIGITTPIATPSYDIVLPNNAVAPSTGQVLAVVSGSSATITTTWITALTDVLASGNIIVGNASGTATPVLMSGDATLSNTGNLQLVSVGAGVTSGTQYTKVTVDGKGRVTSGAQLNNTDVVSGLGYVPMNSVSATSPITLTGGASNPVIGFAFSGVASGAYGSNTLIPNFIVDAWGRITSATTTTYADATTGSKGIVQVGSNITVTAGTISVTSANVIAAMGTLGGDVSGTLNNTVVMTVGGKTSAQISQSVSDTIAATPNNSSGTIVKRDANGDFTARNITTVQNMTVQANLRVQNGMTNYIGITTPIATPSYDIVLPNNTVAPTVGQVLAVASGSTGAVIATNWINALTDVLAPGNIFVGNASGTATGVAMTGDATMSNTGNLQLISMGAGVTSGTQYTKVTVDGKGRVTSGAQLALSDVTTALGYTPTNVVSATSPITLTGGASNPVIGLANSGVTSGTYPKVSVDIWGRVTSGSNLNNADVVTGLGYTPMNSVSATSPITLTGGASNPVIGLANSGVTSGTYPKVSVDIWGRVTSGAQLNNADVVTGLGYTPMNSVSATAPIVLTGGASNPTISLANSGVTAGSYGSNTLIPNFIVDAWGRITSATTTTYADATAGSKGIVQVGSNITVTAGTISITSGNVIAAMGTLGGDVSGTLNNTVVMTVGGKTSAQISQSVSDTIAATPNNSSGTIVKRDANGDFTARNITTVQNMTVQANLRVQNGMTNYIGITTPIATPSYDIVLPNNTVAPTVGQVLAVATGSTSSVIATNWINALTDSLASGFIFVGNASGTATGMAMTGDTTISSAGNVQLVSVGSGVTSGTQYTKVTVDGKGRVTSGAQLASSDVTTALGYTPADDAVSGTYLRKANNLSDLTSSAIARNNLGLGTFATANTVDLGSASATGIIADARLQDFANVTSGTQYTKVTVDGKGRVTSGAQLASSDVTTALGYTPTNLVSAASPLAITGGASNPVISLNTTGVTSGTYPKVAVDAWGRVTSGTGLAFSDVTSGLGYTPVALVSATAPILLTGGTSNPTISLANSGVTAGSYGSNTLIPNFIVDAWGRITSATAQAYADATTGAKGIVQVGANITVSGGTISLTNGNVVSALGYVPYNQATSLAGDVTGTLSATVVSTVGGKTSAQISQSVSDTITATPNNSSGTIVKRDANGDFTARNITTVQNMTVQANLRVQNGSGNYIGITTPLATPNYDIILPNNFVAPTVGQVLAVASGSTGTLIATNWVNALTDVLSPGYIFVGNASGTAAGVAMTGDATMSNAGNLQLISVGSGVTSGTQYTKVTVDGKGRVTSATQLASSDVVAALGFTPADDAVSGTYLRKANNLSDLTSSATARNNLGLGTFATANTVDLGSASATGIIADARLQDFANVTSGTQYTKVTVDGKGRVTSGALLNNADVTTALGYIPMNTVSSTSPITLTGGASNPVIGLANSGVTSGAYPKVSVDIWGRVTSGSNLNNADVVTGLGYTPMNSVSATVPIVLTGGTSNPTISLANSGVTAGSYGSNTLIPNFVVDAWGRITSATAQTYADATTGAKGIVQIGSNITLSAGTISITSGNVIAAMGTLGGDVSGTLNATVVQTVGGKTSAQISQSVSDTITATPNNSSGTIVKRDANGDFTARNITTVQNMTVQANLRVQNGSGNYIGITTPLATPNYDIILPNNFVAPTVGQVLAVASGSTGTLIATTWVNALTDMLTSGYIYVGNASGSATGMPLTGDATISNTGVLTLASVGAGVTSGTQYTKVTVDGKGRVTSATQLASSDVVVALGYTPADDAVSGTYLRKANNLSDLASSATARNNLGLGTFATANTVDLGSASATGIIADARLQNFANVTSGTQYTKVTVDGKGRVTSGAQLAYSDVTAALGYTPTNLVSVASPLAITGGASNPVLSLNTTGVTSGTYPKVTVDAWGRVTSATQLASSDVVAALGYTPSGVVSTTAPLTLTGGASTSVIGLANSGVTAATYGSSFTIPVITVDALGRITTAASQTLRIADTTNTGVVSIGSNITVNGAGQISVTSGNVVAALGYTPVNQAGDTMTGLLTTPSLVVSNTIGLGTAAVTTGAMFEVSSTNRGILIPRMTTIQRNAITSGAAQNGLQIYNTTLGALEYYDSGASAWKTLVTNFSAMTSLNGASNSTQTFTTGLAGTSFNIVTNTGAGVHTFNIPMAATAGVTQGALTNTQYQTFVDKVTSVSGAAGQIVVTGGVSSPVVGLANSGITAGTFGSSSTIPVVTYDVYGRATGVTSATLRPASTTETGVVQVGNNISVTAGTISITSGNVIAALGNALSGDVTGSLSATVVATVGGRTAAQVTTTVDAVASATSANSSGTIVRRDANGNFIANNITTVQDMTVQRYLRIQNGPTNSIGIFAPVGIPNYDIVLPDNTVAPPAGYGLGIQSATSATVQTTWVPMLSASMTSGYFFVGNASGTATAVAMSGDATLSNTGAVTLVGVGAGVTSGTQYTKVTVDGKGRVTSGAQLASADIVTALGYTPVSSSIVAGYLQAANNLSDLTSSATARINLGLGTLAVGNSIDLGSASATGIIADARLLNFTNVTSGTQYTKVTVDGKGRVTSGTQLNNADVVAGLGFSPMATVSATPQLVITGTTSNPVIGLANSGVTSGTYGSATAVPSFSVDAFGRITLAGSQAYADATGASKGIVQIGSNITVTTGTISVTSGNIISALGYTPVNKAGDAMTGALTTPSLVASDTIGIGTAANNAAAILDIVSTTKGILIPRMTTVQRDAIVSGATQDGLQIYNTSNKSIEYYDANATIWKTVTTNFSALTTLNGSTSSTQTFATGSAGTSFGIVTANGVHTFNIPMAATAGVTQGALTNTQYQSFVDKVTSVSAAAGQIVITGTTSSPVIGLANSGVTSGTYGSATAVPSFSVDAFGRITLAGSQAYADATGASKGIVQIGSNITVTTGTISVTSGNIITALGYTPVSSSIVAGYLQAANNLSDLASSATARTNLGLGTLAVGNSIDLGSASATGIIADARLLNFTNVTSGTQYTKVTVDGKGRVTSGTQLNNADVVTGLGFSPMATVSATPQLVITGTTSNPVIGLANSGVTSGTYGSATAVPSFSVDAFGRITLAGSQAYADATGASKGIVQIGNNISVATGVISVTGANVASALGYVPVSSAVLAGYLQAANNLSDLASSATARTNLGLGTLAVGNSIDLGSASATGIIADARLLNFTNVTSGTQYTKVTVDGKGRVTSGAQLNNADVIAGLGFSPMATVSATPQLVITGTTSNPVIGLANSGVTSGTYGSATAVPSFSVDAFGRITLAGSQAYADATGASKGIVQIGSNITVTTGTISVTSGNIITALGYTPVSSSIVAGYLQAANNLSDLASSATARTNLGLGTLAVGNSIDLGSASATGTIADARLLNFTNVTSGTQYTKVTVDGKGRVTSGAQLTNIDVVTGLGFSPMATVSATPQLVITGTASNPVIGLANSGVTSGTYGSATAVPSFSVDAFGRITLAGSQAYADATSVTKGIVQVGNNITVTAGVISIASTDVVNAFGVQAAKTFYAGPLSGAAASSTFRMIASSDLPTSGTTGVWLNGGNSFGTTTTLGTMDNQDLTLRTNGTTRISINTTGSVSFTGQANANISNAGVFAGATGTIDANNGNIMRFVSDSATTAQTITVNNVMPGSAYTMVVTANDAGDTGAMALDCRDSTGAALPASYIPANGSKIATGTLRKSVYTFISDGTNCLVTWITGF